MARFSLSSLRKRNQLLRQHPLNELSVAWGSLSRLPSANLTSLSNSRSNECSGVSCHSLGIWPQHDGRLIRDAFFLPVGSDGDGSVAQNYSECRHVSRYRN